MNCKKCGRKLTNPISIERGYGNTCYRFIQIQEEEEKLQEDSNEGLTDLKNKWNKLSLKFSVMEKKFEKLEENGVNVNNQHPDANLEWNPKPKIKKKMDETKIVFNVVVKELKIILNSNTPLLKKGFRFSDNELGLKKRIEYGIDVNQLELVMQ